MKLLLDQHISYKLADRLADIFPATSHVRLLHLEKASDSDIWHYARAHDFVLVTKDSDMVDLSIARVGPPKVVWLRLGNVTTNRVEEVLRKNQLAIEELMLDRSRSVLEILP